jgi:hypothetical protein
VLFLDRRDANVKSSAGTQRRHESDEINERHAYKHTLLHLQQIHREQAATPREGDEQQVVDNPELPKFGPVEQVMP